MHKQQRPGTGSSARPVIGINMDVSEEKKNKVWLRIGAAYVDAVCRAGGVPLLVPCTAGADLLAAYLRRAHGFLLIGGADYPPASYRADSHARTRPMHDRRAACDLALVQQLVRSHTPLLGICAGHQLLSIAHRGKLIQHIDRAAAHTGEKYHRVKILPGTRLSSILGRKTTLVNSSHHQALEPEQAGDGLIISARADDGTVEAVEAPGTRFLIGVQWHPERIRNKEHRRRLFRALVTAATDTV